MTDLIGYSIGSAGLITVVVGLAWAITNLCLHEHRPCPYCGDTEPDTVVIDPAGEHHVCASCADTLWPDATDITQERAS